jgi:hypothetical protein
MPSVGFEPTIPAFERAKTVHALDRAATVMGVKLGYRELIKATKIHFEYAKAYFLSIHNVCTQSISDFKH